MNLPNGWELILVLLVVVLVFGSKRLPDSARALGRSMRILKAETRGLRDDDDTPGSATSAHLVAPVAVQPVSAPEPIRVPADVPVAQPIDVTGRTPVQPVPSQAYAGQQLFDAQGRPVQLPLNGSQPVQQAPHPQV